jgi:hypothetical protein
MESSCVQAQELFLKTAMRKLGLIALLAAALTACNQYNTGGGSDARSDKPPVGQGNQGGVSSEVRRSAAQESSGASSQNPSGTSGQNLNQGSNPGQGSGTSAGGTGVPPVAGGTSSQAGTAGSDTPQASQPAKPKSSANGGQP